MKWDNIGKVYVMQRSNKQKKLLQKYYLCHWELLHFKKSSRDLGDGSGGNLLVVQLEDPSSVSQNPCQKPGRVSCACNPSAGQAETRRALELTGQPVYPISNL